ncbi:MAG: DUF1329 domain-containing protein [Candidatus Binataceae bacterium]|nr:DUF1329 domain-containing protein [Candidatus Binataceae bacterium]
MNGTLRKGFACSIVFALVTIMGWSPATWAAEPTVPPGTVINMQNWQQYKQFMPDGMQEMFKGTYFWKFPPDFQMVVGNSHHYPPPKTFQEYTEKYSKDVKIVDLPDGRHTISGYVSGLPFPNPEEPNKGYKLLVDNWFAYVPYLQCGNTKTGLQDRFHNMYMENVIFVYRRLSHIGDAGMPITDPKAQGMDYSEYVMVTAPEQARYTTDLTIYYQDYTRPEDTFLFIPALRRSLRLSTAARCTPFIGTDLTLDDPRVNGFNGGIARFDAKYLKDQSVFASIKQDYMKADDWQNNFYQPAFIQKPSLGKFELRDTWVVDVRRIPSQRAGYCYGKRIMWVDKETMMSLWNDIYDATMKPWKFTVNPVVATAIPGEGLHPTPNGYATWWDIQNDHMTVWSFRVPNGNATEANADCKSYYGENMDDIGKFSTAAGLASVMR